jgi:hypothetical protein
LKSSTKVFEANRHQRLADGLYAAVIGDERWMRLLSLPLVGRVGERERAGVGVFKTSGAKSER